jgi:hypothetical protein
MPSNGNVQTITGQFNNGKPYICCERRQILKNYKSGIGRQKLWCGKSVIVSRGVFLALAFSRVKFTV